MNPLLVAKLYRWGAILAIGLALFGFGWVQGLDHEQTKLEAFEASTKALGDAQATRAKQINQQQQDNLKQVTHDLMLNVQAAGDVAVSNYRARYPTVVRSCTGSGAVPEPAAGGQGNDRASAEPVAADQPTDAFVKACAHDAAIVEAWREYRTLNHIPIQETSP